MTTRELIDVSNLSLNARELAREDSTSSQYFRLLQERGLYQDAISFRAHEFAPRKAVEWAAACVKELQAPPQKPEAEDSLKSVERWLENPDDTSRWDAKKTADKAGMSTAADCLAMAVFFSGGSMSPPGAPDTPPPAYASNKMAAGSITIAVLSQMPEKAAERYKRALHLSPVN